ncbi:MAG: phage tail sheath family protein [Oscillospiraceae bacterium]|jgi:hypothetical protein|nr:phage tail sheath family protein [Oscillospiraceae bacterium]
MINAILPGVYIETVAGDRETSRTVSGIVTTALPLSWGDKVTSIRKGADTLLALGYARSDEKMKIVNEIMNYANELILYRLGEGNKARGELADDVTAVAIYGGLRGNDIHVTVDTIQGGFTIKTFLETLEVDSQNITDVAAFRPNGFIEIVGEGTLNRASIVLEGGADAVITAADYEAYKAEIQKYDYNVMVYTGTDASTAAGLVNFTNEQRDRDNMVQIVANGVAANNPAVYNSTIGGKTLAYDLTPNEACATMAGILAMQGIEGSATFYAPVIGWTDVNPRLSVPQQELKTKAGEILFVMRHNAPTVLYDINSLTTFTAEQPEDFRKGLVMRTLDMYEMDLQYLLDTRAVGKIRNSKDGRAQIKGMIVDMSKKHYADPGYIEDFEAVDVTVEQGTSRDSVLVRVGIKVADTTDKIYVTVTAL